MGNKYRGPLALKEIADRIIAGVGANPLIESLSSAPSGFINIRVSTVTMTNAMAAITQLGTIPPSVEKQSVLVDFSSPNIAKEMHVGHLRSTIIGDSICRVLEFCGHDVRRVNHVGDWGTQFGMLITHMEEAYPDFLQNPPNITDLTTFYKNAKKRFDDDEAF